jgi:hypothetical protein
MRSPSAGGRDGAGGRDSAPSTFAADDWVGRVPFTLNSDLAQLVVMT